eukprot:GEMP01023006.1.p1 GENE.GEMP01023006.1~~GEMP01023006.1.p1  ORF type:complete len:461 (+),score=148.13 GEMP01023006.1:42-1385(+)
MAASEQFASVPRAVPPRQKYRDDEVAGGQQVNIMNDRRVVRGNTYASTMAPPEDALEIQKHREAQSQRLRRANQRKDQPGTPEPTVGRKHMDIQTDTYLEELTGRTVAFDAETMTDFLLDRPPSPLFMPAKVGADVDTQIEEGDLFDFDREAEVVLQILVGKTLEISMMEVLEEEEIAAMRRHQVEYERIREQELLEVNRIEAQEQRRADEFERRKTQAVNREALRKQTLNKIASRQVALTYLSSLKKRAIESMADSGAVVSEDTMPPDIESVTMPWLMDRVSELKQERKRNHDLYVDLVLQTTYTNNKARKKVLQTSRAAILEVEKAERRIQWENDEGKRLQVMEDERVTNEQQGVIDQEYEAYVVDVEVVDNGEEGLKLADESTVEFSPELKAELDEKWGGKAEADKVILAVNKTANEVTEVKLIVAEVVPVEGEGEAEAPPAEA